MNIWMKRCLQAGVIGGGMWLLGTGLASAQGLSSPPLPAPAPAVLNAPVSAPVTVCGNSVGLLGKGSASCATGTSGSAGSGSTTARRPLVSVPVTAPVTVCGNAVGRASAGCTVAKPAGSTAGSGTVADVPVTAPTTVCGNGAGLLGTASARCAGQTGSGSGSSAGGNPGVVDVPISAPVTACGNAVGALGSATAGCGSVPPVTGGGTPPSTGGGSSVIGTSSQVDASSAQRAQLVDKSDALAFTGSALVLLEWLAVALLVVGCALTIGWRRHAR